MAEPGEVRREGCGMTVLAALVGTASFLVVLISCGLSAFYGASQPYIAMLVTWIGAGAMAGVMAASIAPRRRWYVAVPLVLVLEFVSLITVSITLGYGRPTTPIAGQVGVPLGMVAGTALAGICRSGMPPRRRALLCACTLGVLLVGFEFAVLAGRTQLARFRSTMCPLIEQLIGQDILVTRSEIPWGHPYYSIPTEDSYVLSVGGYSAGGLEVSIDASRVPGGRAGMVLEGVDFSDLRIRIPQRGMIGKGEQSLKKALVSEGLRPEFVRVLHPYGESDSGVLWGRYHGIAYTVAPNVHYEHPYTDITADGTYSASKP